jgi:hypothetical protein
MQNFTPVVRLTIFVWLLGSSVAQTWATPGFELDLKELKKPTSPPPAAKKKTATAPAEKKQATSVNKQVQSIKKQKTAPTKKTVLAAASQPVIPSELALKGGNSCQLAEQMAVAVARSVPVAPLLNGLDLKPVAAVKHNDLTVLITCGITPAEAYTFARLLEEHQISLLNIQGKETTEQVAQKVVDTLALSYMRENGESGKDGELIYLFPEDRERQRPLRLTLDP